MLVFLLLYVCNGKNIIVDAEFVWSRGKYWNIFTEKDTSVGLGTSTGFITFRIKVETYWRNNTIWSFLQYHSLTFSNNI